MQDRRITDTSVRELLIQIMHEVSSDMWGEVPWHAGSTSVIVLTEERSLREPAFHFAKIQDVYSLTT
jgi:hypothetical protein